MNRQEYIEIKNRAWNWYKNGMMSWILTTIKDFANAPQWAKDAVCYYQGNSKIDFDFVVDRDDVNLLKKYDTQIDTILRASQRLNFKVNYTKELLEFQEAERDSDEYEMIDALCDMIITAMNAGGDLGKEFGSYSSLLPVQNSITSVLNNRGEIYKLCNAIRVFGYDPYKCLCETMKELNTRTGAWNEQEGKWCKDLGAYTEQEAIESAKNIDSNCVMICRPNETIGAPEDSWIFEGEDLIVIKKWYKADYSKCKLGEQNV